jgi:hypothetical protein
LGKIALGNRLGFQAQIEDLRLKCGILREDFKNKISGRNTQGKPVLLFGRGYEFKRPFPLA